MSFNLVTRPWILARMADGTMRELSLRDMFKEASQAVTLACELPVVDVAILRLLAAITMRAAVCWYDETDSELMPHVVWQRLYEDEGFMLEVVERYLDRHMERFDLLDDTDPFMQVPDMHAPNGKTKTPRVIILDFPDSNRGSQFFQRTDETASVIPYSEAARWLLACHAYDVAGIKTGIVGDSRATNGRCPPQGTGWVGAIGAIYLEGRTLRETILLNSPLWESPNEREEMLPAEDLPAWERPTETVRDAQRLPTGPIDTMTWQSRRIWLIPSEDETGIREVMMTNGDRLGFVNQQKNEPMTAWRRNESLEKTEHSATPLYTPLGHMPSRALWRGLNALLPQVAVEDELPGFIMPGNMSWVGHLSGADAGRVIADAQHIRVHAVGIAYGTKGACIDDIIDDTITIVPSLLTEEGIRAAEMARQCVDVTEKAAYALARLGRGLGATVNGKSDDPASNAMGESLRAAAYLELGHRFVPWLGDLEASSDLQEKRAEWLAEVRKVLSAIAYDAVRGMPPASYVGRTCKIGPKTAYVTAGSVESSFWWKLRELTTVSDGDGKENDEKATTPDNAETGE